MEETNHEPSRLTGCLTRSPVPRVLSPHIRLPRMSLENAVPEFDAARNYGFVLLLLLIVGNVLSTYFRYFFKFYDIR